MSLKPTRHATPSYRERLAYHASLLGGISMLCGAVLLISYVETHDVIAKAKAAEQNMLLQQVIPSALHDNDLLGETLEVTDGAGKPQLFYIARQQGQVTGVAFETAEPGYSGLIRVLVGLDKEGTVLGVRTLGHTETPGLGDKIELGKHPWVLSFEGKSLANLDEKGWKVKKDGGVFDQFTGATITPRAYVKAVKKGLDLYAVHRNAIMNKPLIVPPPAPEPPKTPSVPTTR